MNNKHNMQRNESGRIVAGIIIVGVGIALLLRNMGVLLPTWLFTWPIIVILAGIYTGFKHNFKNPSWLIVVAVGCFFLIQKFIPSLSIEPYFWPLIIIGIGVIYILRPGKRFYYNKKQIGSEGGWKGKSSWQNFGEENTVEDTDAFRVNSVFSGVKKNIISKNFTGGQISSVFGGAEIDLTQADIMGTAVLKMEVVFGGVTILVPPHWVVQNDIDGVFHSVEDNRYANAGTIDSTKILKLQGRCVFGGIEIKSY
jgi:predicted membrane protein